MLNKKKSIIEIVVVVGAIGLLFGATNNKIVADEQKYDTNGTVTYRAQKPYEKGYKFLPVERVIKK